LGHSKLKLSKADLMVDETIYSVESAFNSEVDLFLLSLITSFGSIISALYLLIVVPADLAFFLSSLVLAVLGIVAFGSLIWTYAIFARFSIINLRSL